MTAYATDEQFASQGLPQATLDRATAKGVVVGDHLEAQSRFADTFFAARGPVPLAAWDANVTDKVCALAAWTVLCVVGFNPDNPSDRAVLLRYQAALAWLQSVKDTPGAAATTGAGAALPKARVCSDRRRGW